MEIIAELFADDPVTVTALGIVIVCMFLYWLEGVIE